MEKIIQDQELGAITLRWGSRYKRYSLKVSEGKIIATMPEKGDERRMLAFIAENRIKLAGMLKRYTPPLKLNEYSDLQTASFRLQIILEMRKNIGVTLAKEILTIRFPDHLELTEERYQEKIREILKNVFRSEAKRLLPARLDKLAKQYGFTYKGVKINSSRTRWGSCTSQKGINLSLQLMQLPWHLIDYVLLHELCHTKEMNHGPHFWELMNNVTDHKAKALRQELKRHRMI